MGCPSEQQILEFVLTCGDEASATAAHLQRCPACMARVTALRALAATLSEAHARFDDGHAEARARLMATLTEEVHPAMPLPAWKRTTTFIGVLTMRQRFAVGSIGIAAILAFFFLWGATKPTSAIAEMAENIRRARSWKASTTFEIQFVPKAEQPVAAAILTSTDYWLAPGATRTEAKGDQNWGRKDELTIQPVGQAGISIDHKMKTFRRTPARLGYIPPLAKLEELGKYSGQADRQLEDREINGKTTSGFEIDLVKIDPSGGPGRVQVWIDPETKLPALFCMESQVQGQPAKYTMRDFQWNIDLDPMLFDPTPPPGYRDATPKPPSVAEQVARITKGLEIYRELSGGHYPGGKMVYGDVTRDEMFAMIGIQKLPPSEQMKSDKYPLVMKAVVGLGTINRILTDNSDAAYHGKTVGPKDAERILLRWKLDDGRYQAIYGDLRGEIFPPEQVRGLGGK